MSISRFPLLLTFCCFIASCASIDNPALDTFKDAFKLNSKKTVPLLNPKFNYLRVEIGTNLSYLASVPTSYSSSQYWYSAKKDSIQLDQGRLTDISGSLIEWHRVKTEKIPNWQELMTKNYSISYYRSRDQMPGYQFNIVEHLTLRKLDFNQQPAFSLQYHQAQHLLWFKEINLTHPELSSTYYALEKNKKSPQVVFSHICLTKDYCLNIEQVPNPTSGQQ